MELSKRTLKRTKNLEPFCDFDTENAVATLHLRFKNASDLIDETISEPNAPVISSGTLDLLESLQEMIPEQFTVNRQILIENYEDYSPQIMESALFRAAEIRNCKKMQDKNQKRSKMAVFVIVGLVLLLIVIFNAKYRWFGFAGLPLSMLIAYFLELIFEVYFEEGVSYFLVKRLHGKFKDRNRFGTVRCL